jgi:hypothetical protein
MRILSALLVVLLSLSRAAASDYTAHKFYQDCTGLPGSSGKLGCAAYITGLVDGLMIGKTLAGTKLTFCPPKDLTTLQAQLIIEKFIQDQPKSLNKTADIVSVAAMTAAYPCPAKNSN